MKRGGQRQEKEKKWRKQRERAVYKQTPFNKFVFSGCRVSVVCEVLPVWFLTVAIHFTECWELLIRLANGACNFAENKTQNTVNHRKKLQLL